MNRDRQKLIEFLEALEEMVNELLERYIYAFGELGRPAISAWTEVLKNFEQTKSILRGESPPPPPPPYDPERSLDDRLADVGLTGDQLEFKLAGFQRALEAWRHEQVRDRPKGWRRFLPGARGARRIRRVLSVGGRVLKWADVALGSLASVIHLSEPIKEAKEGIEAALADATDVVAWRYPER